MISIKDMVSREVNVCLSALVSTLAGGYGQAIGADSRGNGRLRDLEGLCEQAFELASPVPDYEEAAIQAGWTGPHKDQFGATYFEDETAEQSVTWCCANWEALCRDQDIEPHDREVFEHWAVSSWLAEKLAAYGEKVDTDFAGMNVWARTTTGQAIHADSVIERIYADMMKA
jgi:hypothetical protein